MPSAINDDPEVHGHGGVLSTQELHVAAVRGPAGQGTQEMPVEFGMEQKLTISRERLPA